MFISPNTNFSLCKLHVNRSLQAHKNLRMHNYDDGALTFVPDERGFEHGRVAAAHVRCFQVPGWIVLRISLSSDAVGHSESHITG